MILNKTNKFKKGFTLLELLIVIGILAILSAVTILVINPSELLKKSRDTSRINDLAAIKSAITVLMGNSSIDFSVCSSTQVYVSLPTEDGTLGAYLLDGTGKTFHQVARADLYKMDGTGWIPLNLSPAALGNVLSKLPTDPQQFYSNSNPDTNPAKNYFYTFSCTPSGSFEINAKTESRYYGFTNRDGYAIYNAAVNNAPIADGGDNGLFESGTSLTLIPDSGLCPVGMVWVPSPAMVCMDRYEASYGSGYTVAGVACSNCAVSKSNANPWTTRSGWPSVSQLTAITYCANVGKVLPSDFEWYVAASGTPDADTDDGNHGPCMIWNSSSADGLVPIPAGSTQCTDGYVWGSDTNPNIKTGTAFLCVSSVGAYDMIGNVWEWVSDLQSGSTYSGSTVPGASGSIATISNKGVPLTVGTSAFNNDYYYVGVSGNTGLRSGGWGNGSNAGRFALSLNFAPGYTSDSIGFRCALRQ